MAHLIVFAKAPVAGQVKTRLAAALGEQGAAHIAARMLEHTLEQVRLAGFVSAELCGAPAAHPLLARAAHRAGLAHSEQGEGDLGQRMYGAMRRALREHREVLLIGTDCPALHAPRLRLAADRLRAGASGAFFPTLDGGYCLVGLRRLDRSLFDGIAWSTPEVMPETRRRLRALGWDWWEGETLEDVDEPAQLSSLPVDWLQTAG